MARQEKKHANANLFGERLSLALQRSGITQAELSSRTGIAESTISRWFADSHPQRRTVRAVADAIGVRYDWLQEGIGEMISEIHPDAPLASKPQVSDMPESLRVLGTVLDKLSVPVLTELVKAITNDESRPLPDRLADCRYIYNLAEQRARLAAEASKSKPEKPKP